MKPDNDPEHLDFVVLSAHKMYAPYGTGALIGPQELFLASGPDYSGGGTVDIVTHDKVYWGGLPDREEAGSPNVVGAVALAEALRVPRKSVRVVTGKTSPWKTVEIAGLSEAEISHRLSKRTD